MAVKIDSRIETDFFGVIKFQLLAHCFVNNIKLNETELNLLTLLGTTGEIRLAEFAKLASEKGYLGSEIAVNNSLTKIVHSNLFLKKGVGKKLISLNPELNIAPQKGTVILNYIVFTKGESS